MTFAPVTFAECPGTRRDGNQRLARGRFGPRWEASRASCSTTTSPPLLPTTTIHVVRMPSAFIAFARVQRLVTIAPICAAALSADFALR